MAKETYRLELEFSSPYPLKDPGMAGRASGYIFVKCYSQRDDGRLRISLDCASFAEMEHEIDKLKDELEIIREAAKEKFALHDKRRASS